MIRAVIFDMDGLLIDSEPLWRRTVVKVYKTVGINITENVHNGMKGRTALENAEYFYDLQPWKGPTPKELSGVTINEMVELVKTDAKLMPGVDRVVQICKKQALPIAIASSSPMKLIDAVVDVLKIRDHFNHIYSAQFEAYGKPHPGVFIKVAEHFGVPAVNCLVFEDSPPGVLAAKAANMKCVAVPELGNKSDKFIQTADLILDSLEDFNAVMLESL